jgi:type IV pilus assembly protein PilN
MIRVNLLPVKQIRAKVSRRRDLIIAGSALGLTLVITLGVHLYQTYQISTLENENTALRAEIKALDLKVKDFGELQKKIKEFESKHQIIADLNRRKVGPVRMMESLSAATPGSLWLTEFKESAGKLVLTGMAVDNQTVADFLKALSNSHYFHDVELVETKDAGLGAGPVKKFSVRSMVSYQPPPDTSANAAGQAAAQQEKKG